MHKFKKISLFSAIGGTVFIANDALPPYRNAWALSQDTVDALENKKRAGSMAAIVSYLLQGELATDDSYIVDQNTQLNVTATNGIFANDDTNLPFSLSLIEGVQNGMLNLQPDGSFTYLPGPNFVGTDTFRYSLTTMGGQSDDALVSIRVNGLPDAVDDDVSTAMDVVLNGSIIGNDTLVDGTVVDAVTNAATTNGNITINADGDFVYTPNTNFVGIDSFVYTLRDTDNDTDTAIITIIVGGPIILIPDAQTVNEDSSASIPSLSVIDHDNNVQAVQLQVNNGTLSNTNSGGAMVTGSGTATLTLQGSQAAINTALADIVYSPTADFNGADVLTVTATNSALNTATETINITINPANDGSPDAINDSFSTPEDVVLSVSASNGVLANDNLIDEADVDPVTNAATVLNGSITITADGSFSYTPPAGQTGVDTFIYTLRDADDETDTATISISIGIPEITSSNRSIAENDSFTDGVFTITASAGLATTGTALAVTIDGVTTNLTLAQLNGLPGANIILNNDGSTGGDVTLTNFNPSTGVVTYAFDPDGNNQDHPGGAVSVDNTEPLTIIATDVNSDSNIADILTISVTDTEPTANNDQREISEGSFAIAGNAVGSAGASTGDVADILVDTNATPVTDIDFGSTDGTPGSNLLGNFGTFNISNAGVYTYTLDNTNSVVQGLGTGESTTDVFTYTITDGDGDTDTATVTTTINGVNDAATITVTGNSITEENITTATVVASFIANDLENDPLSFSVLNDPNGYFSISGTDVLLTAAGVAAVNNDSLDLTSLTVEVQADDGNTSFPFSPLSDSDTISITRVNDNAPTISVMASNITEESIAVNDVVATFTSSDPDGDSLTHSLLNDPNGYFSISGTDLVLTAAGVTAINDDSLDLSSLTIEVQADDGTFQSSDSDSLSITRVNDNTPTISVTASNITEESISVNDVVATFSSNDLDGDSLTHSLLNDPNGYFSISGTDVVLTTAGVAAVNDDSLDLTSLTVEVQADDGTFQSSDSDTVSITRIDDAAPTLTIADEDASATSADHSVLEATGSTINGTATITAAAGISSLTISGQDITNASATNVSVTGSEGTLVVTAFNASTGVINYNYTEDGNAETHNAANDNINDSFTLMVTDHELDTATDTLDIQILDSTPKANNDQRSVLEGGGAIAGNAVGSSGAQTGDELDTIIDTNASPVTDIDFGSTDGTVGTGIASNFGSFVINSAGVYTYTLDNANPTVQGLKSGESETEVFTYTITDGDGDTDTASITVTINGVEDAPPAITIPDNNGSGVIGDSSVVENSVILSGQFTLTAAAGIASATVDGQDITNASLSTVNITGNNGALVVNNFNAGTGVASFTYDPTGSNSDHSAGDLSITDQFTIALSDNEGESTSDTLDILITDTAPTAAPDTASITEDFAPNPVTGNVTTNDTQGADTAISVSAVDFGGAQTVGTPFSSDFGIVDINADGTYTYTLDNGNLVINDLDTGESVAETFSYTIVDTDGDTSTTTLAITVNGTTD